MSKVSKASRSQLNLHQTKSIDNKTNYEYVESAYNQSSKSIPMYYSRPGPADYNPEFLVQSKCQNIGGPKIIVA